jgi:peptidoglycan/xylan/chitin deacetylase (PgdA/CDA1 family)
MKMLRTPPVLLLSLLLLLTVAGAVPGEPLALITHGPRNIRRVALTFDADMTPRMEKALQTGKVKTYDNVAVRRILRATRTPATFFFTGMWAESYPKPAREIAQDPLFEVEDHSYDHPGFEQPCYGLASISEAHKRADIERAQAAIFRVTGGTPRYFRFPGGCEHPQDLTLVRKLGLIPLGWDVVSGDAGQDDPGIIIRNVLKQAQDGSIIVMHSHGGKAPATALSLPAIIAGLKARGFTFVKVTDLLHPSGR